MFRPYFLFTVFVFSLSTFSFAGLEEFTSTTWNMQGANESSVNEEDEVTRTSMWAQNVAGLVTRFDVVALQEVGARPASAINYGNNYVEATFRYGAVNQSHTRTSRVTEYFWNGMYWIYHLEVDVTRPGMRTNLAIVTRIRAENIFLIPPVYNDHRNASGNRDSLARRPTVGIQIVGQSNNPTTIYSFHAGSHSHNDAEMLLNALSMFHDSAGRNFINWSDFTHPNNSHQVHSQQSIHSTAFAVLGDFNRNILGQTDLEAADDIVQAPIEVSLIRSGFSSHGNMGNGVATELDYAFASNDTVSEDPPVLAYLGDQHSNHTNVEFWPVCRIDSRCNLGKDFVDQTHANTKLQINRNNSNTNRVTIILVDEDGDPVPNVNVKFAVHVGRGKIVTPTGKTNSAGKFSSDVKRDGASSAVIQAWFDSSSNGNAGTTIINGNRANLTFATGG